MGCENRPEPVHPFVDERFGVLGLVGGDQLESLADERETQIPGRQPEIPVAGSSEEKIERDD